MRFIIIAFLCLLALFFIFKLVLPANEPNFKLSGGVNNQKIGERIFLLGNQTKNFAPLGKGLSSKLIVKYIKRAYKIIDKKYKSGEEIFEFEKWLYDNYYKLNESIDTIKKQLSSLISVPHIDGLPRIYMLMELIVKSSDGYVTPEILSKCVKIYNDVTPLLYSEITTISATLKFALLEFIAIYAAKCVKINTNIARARRDKKLERVDLTSLAFNSYIYEISKNIPEKNLSNLLTLCSDNGLDLISRTDNFFHMTALYNGALQSAVTTLHAVDSFMTDEYILSLSPIFESFSQLEGSNFPIVTTATKFLYLSWIYNLSKKQKTSEQAVLHKAYSRSIYEKKDIAHFILPAPRGKFYMYLYIFSVLVLTAVLGVFASLFIKKFALMFVLVSLPILMSLSTLIVTMFVNMSVKRRYLPLLDIKKASGINCGTAITVSRLIGSRAEIEDSMREIETTYYANNDKIFTYCLLYDFLMSDQISPTQSETELMNYAQELYDKLPEKHRFLIMFRARQAIKGDKKFQGWEKKRGALLQFNEFLLKDSRDNFYKIIGDNPHCEYVIALDSDTKINSCYELVEMMAHPYNKAAVISINMNSSPQSAKLTHYSKLFAGGVGLNSYSNYYANSEFDCFGQGNYTGKGIYRVSQFYEKVHNAFEDNRIVSHDYIEGAYAGCSNCNVEGVDNFPRSFSSFLTRQLRWLRGDVQLLPHLFPIVKNGEGKRIKNPISPISKWHIFCNIFFALSPLSTLSLLFLSLLSVNILPVIILAFSMPIIYIALSIRHSALNADLFWVGEVFRQAINVMLLPVQAVLYTYSIFLTLVRLITKTKLLEWRVFAHEACSITILPNFLVAAAFITLTIIFKLNPFFFVLSAFFVFGGFVDAIFARVRIKKKHNSLSFNSNLSDLFTRTFKYFDIQLKPENNFLPSDNFQKHLDKGFCDRTSPTNIGFMVAALVCGFKMQTLTYEQMSDKLEKVITSIEKLPKWEGNLYNWMNIYTMQVLSPKFVSSVDSGNFLACLLLALSVTKDKLNERIAKLINDTRIEKLFDFKRELFYIGYDETSGYTRNHYDLLGSESSLTYIVAVSLAKIDKIGWLNLSRQMVRFKGDMLYSWTGGAFEHLMTELFFRSEEGTLSFESNKNVVKSQIAYAKNKKYPAWGVSESQYSQMDDNGNYLYRAFGIPEIAHANIDDGGIIAPYASILALPFDDRSVEKNLSEFLKLDLVGEYGLMEAYDVNKNVKIETYMSHHQGMILCALVNYLEDDCIVKSIESLASGRAAQLLLCHVQKTRGKKKIKAQKPLPRENEYAQFDKRHNIPYINLLSNGKFNLTINEYGGSRADFDKISVNRCEKYTDGLKLFAQINGDKYDLQRGKFTIERDGSCFIQKNELFLSCTRASVLPNLNGEVRKVTFTNLSLQEIEADFYSYMEVIITPALSDISHKTYSSLFVKTELDKTFNYVYALRSGKDFSVCAAHYVKGLDDPCFETSRFNYFNRGKKADSLGEVLDPIFSFKAKRTVKSKETISFEVYTLVDYDINALRNSVNITLSDAFYERVSGVSYALSEVNLLSLYEKKEAAVILYGGAGTIKSRELKGIVNTNYPIVSLTARSPLAADKLREQLKSFKKLFLRGISFNLVVTYQQKNNDFFLMSDKIHQIIDELQLRKSLPIGGTLNVINQTENVEMARLVKENSLDFDKDFSEFIFTAESPQTPYENVPMSPPTYALPLGKGGFLEDGSYSFCVNEDTPNPWSNIICDHSFGTIITESGGGYTFEGNSRENKLTNFSNDPVLDSAAESVILGERGNFWSISKRPAIQASDYFVTHSFGYTRFNNNFNGILSEQTEFIAINKGIKFFVVSLENCENIQRDIDVLISADTVLGDFKNNCVTGTEYEFKDNFLTAQNLLNLTKVYLGCDRPFLNVAYSKEAYVSENKIFTLTELKNTGITGALVGSVKVTLPPLCKKRVIFSLGTENNVIFENVDIYLNKAMSYFSGLSKVNIKSGDDSLRFLFKWLPYQVLSSRFFGRVGFYQAGGAIGFRDQLQDCMSLLFVDPSLVKNHILDCAAHQFENGDVQHWWHAPDIGVRTKISDDRYFLPYLVAEYINFTRDFDIMAMRVPYLNDIPLSTREASVYASPGSTARKESILEHCIKALKCFKLGDNGLLLIGGGDWNDALDEVGKEGKGTSVWCSMFLYECINKFLPFINDLEDIKFFKELKEELKNAVDRAWDGEWYTRAYTDDGKVLGSITSEECKIDLLSQSYATISDIGIGDKPQIALYSAYNNLVDKSKGIIKLLSPPFKNMKGIGYISAYPRGVRENGGQYTHAAVWFIMSFFKIGKIEDAYQMLKMINPINKTVTKEGVDIYRVEPYVISADIYAETHIGRGGWSWYTGSASWLYRCITDCVLGLTFKGASVSFNPKLPKSIPEMDFSITTEFGELDITIDNRESSGEWRVVIGGISYNTCGFTITPQIVQKKIILKKLKVNT